jgi:hypothetical protein
MATWRNEDGDPIRELMGEEPVRFTEEFRTSGGLTR